MLSSLPQAYICGRGLFKTLQALIFCSDQTPRPSHPLFKIWNWRLSSTKGGGGGGGGETETVLPFFIFFHSFLKSEAQFLFYSVLIYKELTENLTFQQLKIQYATLHFMSVWVLAICVMSVVK